MPGNDQAPDALISALADKPGAGLKPVPSQLVKGPRVAAVSAVASRVLKHFFGELNMVETKTSYKCTACGMIKTISSDQKAPTCCGKVMQITEQQKPGESNKGSCCSG